MSTAGRAQHASCSLVEAWVYLRLPSTRVDGRGPTRLLPVAGQGRRAPIHNGRRPRSHAQPATPLPVWASACLQFTRTGTPPGTPGSPPGRRPPKSTSRPCYSRRGRPSSVRRPVVERTPAYPAQPTPAAPLLPVPKSTSARCSRSTHLSDISQKINPAYPLYSMPLSGVQISMHVEFRYVMLRFPAAQQVRDQQFWPQTGANSHALPHAPLYSSNGLPDQQQCETSGRAFPGSRGMQPRQYDTSYL